MNTPSGLMRHAVGVSYTLWWMIRHSTPSVLKQLLSEHWDAYARMQRNRRHYKELSIRDMERVPQSKRVFVFGSGYSLNDIPDEEWQNFARHDTLGFSGSIYLKKIPLTYLLLRAWTETPAGSLAWKKDAEEVLGAIEGNPFLERTIFVLPKGVTAIFTNRLIGYQLWNVNQPVHFFLPDKISKRPHRKLADGLAHGKSTLCSAISLAVAQGYTEIVLVGVDLYDSRYFWLPPDKTMGWSQSEGKLVAADQTVRGAQVQDVHNTVNNGIITFIGDWADFLAAQHGIRLTVYNPKSLLTSRLDIFSWKGERA